MKSRILITGGSGLLGVNWAIVARDRYEVFLGMHSRQINVSNTKSVFIDANSIDSIKRSIDEIGPDLVIHTAGLTSVEYCESHPSIARDVNVTIASNLAAVCNNLHISMVHISTDHLFDGSEPFVDEGAQLSPLNFYGKTKAEAELRVLDTYPETLVIRTNFYGWGTSYRLSFSDFIINTLRKSTPIRLFNDIYYTPILAKELILVTHDLLAKKAKGIFNVVGDDRISKYEFGLQLAERFNLNANLIEAVSIKEQSNLVLRPGDMSLSNRKTSSLLNKKIGGFFEHIEKLKLEENGGIAMELGEI